MPLEKNLQKKQFKSSPLFSLFSLHTLQNLDCVLPFFFSTVVLKRSLPGQYSEAEIWNFAEKTKRSSLKISLLHGVIRKSAFFP